MSRYDKILTGTGEEEKKEEKEEKRANKENSEEFIEDPNWQELINRADNYNIFKSVRNYLRTMYYAGVKLNKNKNGYLVFEPGSGPGWEYDRESEKLDARAQLQETATTFYTYLVAVPAKIDESPAWDAIKYVIQIDGYIGPGKKALKFYWDQIPDTEEGKKQVEQAREMLNKVSGEIRKYLNKATEDAVRMGVTVIK